MNARPVSLCLLLVGGLATAAEPGPDGVAFFEKHIRPVLVTHCYKCHSAAAAKPKGGLRLDSRSALRQGGANGPVIVPGQPDKSRLIQALRYADPHLHMPPAGTLSPAEVAAFETWVRLGAPDPRTAAAAPAKEPAGIDWQQARRFWSFRPVQDPPLPRVRHSEWVGNDVDRFIVAGYESRGLTPVPPADKRALLRRATFDLTGLPPTPEEVDAFLADAAPDAFAKVVDRLLASRHYGEKWGRHWLDLVRYADTAGCNSDFPVPYAYHYRDYVIDAFNRDKPYDQFIREQIAGDLLAFHARSAERARNVNDAVVATGYLAIARRFVSAAAEFHLTLEDVIDNVGKTVLGLSVGCARCHDHKFDPIPQTDYYALYGIFNSTKFAFPGTELYRHSHDFVPLGTPEQAEALRKYAAEMAELDRRRGALLDRKSALEAAAKTGQPAKPGTQTLEQVKAELGTVLARIEQLEFAPPAVDRAYAVAEGTPADARVQVKGDPKKLGAVASRGFLQVLGGQCLPSEEKGSGRRQLAEWLTDPHNPLTARVLVNRLWQHHFGKGLVATPSDFGTRGRPPTHPELLDYLATRFMQSGWSVKAMHRFIMLSRTYQLSSSNDSRDAAIDVNNDRLWRSHRRRLSAEEIRDALLAVSGALDRTPGGPHPFPPETTWRYTQHTPFIAVYDSHRRSVYLMQQRIKKHPFLELFDGADPNAPTAERALSTTALQALYLLNDPFMHDQADRFAARVGLALPEEARQVDYAYRLALARPATATELADARHYLDAVRARLGQAGVPWDQRPRAALASYLRVLLSSNEFFFVD
jgi:hypothetical protein